MSGGRFAELEYLGALRAKYGAHYLKKYFGFSLGEMADKLGLNRSEFSGMVNGRVSMPEKHKSQFITLFKEMKIEEITKDFKESPSQLSWKESWTKTKNLLTILVFYGLILTMQDTLPFLKSKYPHFLEYIVGKWHNLTHKLNKTLSVAVTFIVTSSLIFLHNLLHFFNNYRTSTRGAIFCFKD